MASFQNAGKSPHFCTGRQRRALLRQRKDSHTRRQKLVTDERVKASLAVTSTVTYDVTYWSQGCIGSDKGLQWPPAAREWASPHLSWRADGVEVSRVQPDLQPALEACRRVAEVVGHDAKEGGARAGGEQIRRVRKLFDRVARRHGHDLR